MRSYEKYVTADSDYYVYTPSALAQKLFFYPVCIGHFHYEPGYHLKRNNYDSFLLMLIIDGTCSILQKDSVKTASAGDVILLDCYVPHQYFSKTGCESLWIHFDGPMCRDYCEHLIHAHGNIWTPGNTSAIKQTLRHIYHTFQNSMPIVEAKLSRDIMGMLTGLFLYEEQKEMDLITKPSLSTVISYINEHFTESISLETLADLASLSPYYFTRVFFRQTGMTPHQYLIATRIGASKFLLKTTDIPVKEIGFSCGFSSESSFCTTFRKWERMTPSEYRSSNTQ